MADLPRQGRFTYTIIAASTAVISSAMLCFIHPLFQIMNHEWSFGSIDPYMQMVLLAAICILFAIGVGATHLHGRPRRRISAVAALVSVVFLMIAYHFVFVVRDAQVVFITILVFMITLSITSFSLLEPLLDATRLALRCPENSGRVMNAIIAGILLGGTIGAIGYWAGSFSIYWLFTAWSIFSNAGAATIFLARRLPAPVKAGIFSRVEVQAEARAFFSEILFTCVIAVPGMVILAAESARLNNLSIGHVNLYFVVLVPVSIAIAAVVETIIVTIQHKRNLNARTTMASSYAFLLALTMFIVGGSFVYFRFIDITTWLLHEPAESALIVLLFILVIGVFWATPVLMAIQRATFTLANSKLPGWVNGFALGLFWLVISVTQAFATEIGNLFFNDLNAWILGVTIACSAAGLLIIAGVAMSRMKIN